MVSFSEELSQETYFPRPEKGQSLMSFLSSQDFHTCAELDKVQKYSKYLDWGGPGVPQEGASRRISRDQRRDKV